MTYPICHRRRGRRRRRINRNFGYGDVLLTLKYSPEGIAALVAWAEANRKEDESWEDAVIRSAEHEADKYLRRIARVFKKMGVVFKYILVTSDMDGDTGESARIHHHLILPKVCWETATELWKLGWVDYQYLKKQDDYNQLAEYLYRQVRRRPDAKKYRPSRNLEHSIVNERWAKAGEELKPDRGATLMERGHYEPGRPQYIRFVKQAVPKRTGEKQTTGERGDAPAIPPPARRGRARGEPEHRG